MTLRHFQLLSIIKFTGEEISLVNGKNKDNISILLFQMCS